MIHKLNLRAFTTLELVVVVALIGILTTIVLLGLSTVGRSTNIESVSDEVKASLNEAQNKALSNEDGSKWGVRFDFPASSSHTYSVFKGNDSTTGTSSGKKSLPRSFSFGTAGDININGCTTEASFYCDVVFGLNGTTANFGIGGGDSVILSVFHDGLKVDIVVTSSGLVEVKPAVIGNPTPPPPPPPPPNCGGGTWNCVDVTAPVTGDIGQIVMDMYNGLPQIAYIENATDLYYIRCTDINCTSANQNKTFVANVTDYFGVSIAVGSDGRARITHSGTAGTRKLTLQRCTNDSCTTKVTTEVGPTDILRNWIELDASNNPRIAYSVNNGHATFKKCNDQDCTTGATVQDIDITNQSGRGISMALSGGNAHSAYYTYISSTNQRVTHAQCTAAANDCSGSENYQDPEGATVTTLQTDTYDWTSIDLNSSGFSRFVYNNNTNVAGSGDCNDYCLRIASCDSVSCGSPLKTTLVTSTSIRPRWSSIKVGTDNVPRISYTDYAGKRLMYIECTVNASNQCNGNASGYPFEVDDYSAGTSLYAFTALGLRGSNSPVIAYYSESPKMLRIAYR